MKIFVTGSTGLLGSAVVRLGAAAGHTMWTSEGDLREPRIAEAQLAIASPDVVVNCAAKIGGIKTQQADPSAAVTDNLILGVRLFEACAKSPQKPLLVFVSSSTVYPTKQPKRHFGILTVEDDFLAAETWPLKPEPLYQGVGGVKVYLESLLDFYRDKFGLRSVVVRPTAIYGPGDRSDHVIPGLLKRALGGEVPLNVWGSPGTVRDFVYVDDVARGIFAAVTSTEGASADMPRVFNLGSGTRTTMQALADSVMLAVHGPHKLVELEDRYGPGKAVVFDSTQPSAINFRQVSIEKAKEILRWEPTTSLATGLTATTGWLRAVQAETRH